MGNEEPVSIPSMMKRNANEVPNAPALKAKDPETGKEVSCVCFHKLESNQISDMVTKRYLVINRILQDLIIEFTKIYLAMLCSTKL